MALTSKEVSANRTSTPNLIIKLGARIVRAGQTFHRAAMCSHCGRYHVATLVTCLMFDHPSANQSATWPTGKPPLNLETPEAWTAWLKTKTKTHPALIEEFTKKSKERKALYIAKTVLRRSQDTPQDVLRRLKTSHGNLEKKSMKKKGIVFF